MLVFIDDSEILQADELAFAVEDSSLLLPWLAVLSSQELTYRTKSIANISYIIIQVSDAERVNEEIKLYQENISQWQLLIEIAPENTKKAKHSLEAAFLFFLFFLLFHLYVNDSSAAWRELGIWNAELIKNGEIWRGVTALTLHADFAHILANFFWGSILLSLLINLEGFGLSIFLMLLSGTLANLSNAYFLREASYKSLGASTMVFGLLGILAARECIRIWQHMQSGKGLFVQLRLWLPLVAGGAVLAIWGTAPGTDLAAHLAGFITGLILSVIVKFLPETIYQKSAQIILSIITISIFIVAWIKAWN